MHASAVDSSDDESTTLVKKQDAEGSTNNKKHTITATEIVKFLSYPVVFLIVLGGTVVSKGTILLMTSQLRSNGTILYCNRLLHRDKTFVITVPEEEKITWIWCIIFAFSAPQVLTFIRSTIICVFVSAETPKFLHFVLFAGMETLHVIGLAMMAMIVLPELDSIQGAMLTSCVCFVPGLLGLLSRNKKRNKFKQIVFVLVDIAALAAQAVVFVVWPLLDIPNSSLWFVPAALFLTSCGWWENYVSIQSPLHPIRFLGEIKENMRPAKNFTYIFVPVVKIVAFVVSCMLILHLRNDAGYWYLFEEFGDAFSRHSINVSEVQPAVGGLTTPDISDVLPDRVAAIITTDSAAPIYALVIQILSAFFAYFFGKFACKTLIQGFGLAVPINLTIPVLISLLIATCELRNGNPCFFHGIIPDYLFFDLPSFPVLSQFFTPDNALVWLPWLLSQTWITIHIFTPKCVRPEATEKLFVTPYYDGLLIDQSMGLNRKRDDQPPEDPKKRTEGENGEPAVLDEPVDTDGVKLRRPISLVNDGSVPKIYVCATMWREKKGEMAECLKSILLMDSNQCAMRNYQECSKEPYPGYYELEIHIFFDKAFQKSKVIPTEVEINDWVRQLIEVLKEATGACIEPMLKVPTHYGGRLVWTLPGGNQLFIHLKNETMIRPKKRWSQVMYMYYLLQHRLNDLKISKERKRAMKKNTFILALDGDISFQPSAIDVLLDLMEENANLGAACGRIHPLGSGLIVWYQKFEYAVGHWLQKATEHTIGCVLCSPGCLSLFRAKALMKSNVMDTYKTKSSEARHFIQYDQGEDRWLCTLLLKRGYRVEYSAASDSYTHAPEGFYEFYKQRRRWLPSTMANNIDLLENYKRVVARNKNISRLYMLYQLLLMAGTILGPGTIYLMLVGAFIAVFKLGIWESFGYNAIPVLIFVVVCFTCNSEIQLFIAAIISMAYGLVMMAVIVGILIQIFEDGWLSPSSMFLILIIGQIVITALMHPKELYCLPYAVIYFLTIPSMYLLLMIYSIANLNDPSWGTRVDANQTDQGTEEEKQKQQKKKADEEAKKKPKQNSLCGLNKNDQGSVEISCAGLFKCILCTHGTTRDEDDHLVNIEKSLERLEKRFNQPEENASEKRPDLGTELPIPQESTRRESDSETSETSETHREEYRQPRNPLVNPFWIEDKSLEGKVDYLSCQEEEFWERIIWHPDHGILSPDDDNEKKIEEAAAQRKDLRDKSFVTFFMLNALFVTTIFLMQLNQDLLNIKWPIISTTNITFDRESLEVHIARTYLQLEPIGLVFVAFFGIILVIQFTAMLFHRLGTFTHILASTSLEDWGGCWEKPEKTRLREHAKDIVKGIQDPPSRLQTGEQTSRPLDDVFRQRILSMSEGTGLPSHVSHRKSMQIRQALRRSQSIATERRLSQTRASEGNNSHQANRRSVNVLSPISEVTEIRGGVDNEGFEMNERPNSVG